MCSENEIEIQDKKINSTARYEPLEENVQLNMHDMDKIRQTKHQAHLIISK